jgi:hypothetical protein
MATLIERGEWTGPMPDARESSMTWDDALNVLIVGAWTCSAVHYLNRGANRRNPYHYATGVILLALLIAYAIWGSVS